jgi:hypothetical protein
MKMSFAQHFAFDAGLDLMVGGQTNGIPPMFACFDYQPASSVPEGRDCVVVAGRRNHKAIPGHIAKRAKRAVVIVCPGDQTFWNKGAPIPANIMRIFTTNRLHADPRVTSVPLGVRSSKQQLLRYARRHRPSRNHWDRALLYLNFAMGSRYDVPAEQRGLDSRRNIADRLRGEKWVTDRLSAEAVKGKNALYRYYTEVMQHKFIVSPEGFGIDCYRHWESLYLGAIPIVQRSEHMETFSDLPILYTDDYSEITEAYLRDVYEDFCSRTFDFSKLYAPYYSGLLVDSVSQLEDPACILLLSEEKEADQWPAKLYLSRLSRYLDPHRDLKTGNLIPASEHDQPNWRATDGAHVRFDADGGLVVESTSETHLAGASLELSTINGVTYRVHGEFRRNGSSIEPAQLRVIDPLGTVYGEATLPDGESRLNFTFNAAKQGTCLQFRPGCSGTLSIKIEPAVDLVPTSEEPMIEAGFSLRG